MTDEDILEEKRIGLKIKIARLKNQLVRTIKGKIIPTPYNKDVLEQIDAVEKRLETLT